MSEPNSNTVIKKMASSVNTQEWGGGKSKQLLAPQSSLTEVLHLAHVGFLSAHVGVEKTIALVT